MYLLQLNREFLLIDDDLWERVLTFDKVSRRSLAGIVAHPLTEETATLLVRLELFQASNAISGLVLDVNREIAEKLNSVLSLLSGQVAGKAQAVKIPALLARYRDLAEQFATAIKAALRQKRNDELNAEAERIRAEMESIFETIAEIIKSSYASVGIVIDDEEILAMVNGERDDLLAAYTGALR